MEVIIEMLKELQNEQKEMLKELQTEQKEMRNEQREFRIEMNQRMETIEKVCHS